MTRLPQPLPTLGPGKARWKEHHARSRRIVMLRSRGMCENPDCKKVTRRLEWAHLLSRGHLIEEPYCSSPELTLALCCYDPMTNSVGCHERIDRGLDPKLRHKLQVIAATRFYEKNGTRKVALIASEPTGAVRRLVRKLEKEAA